MRENSTKRPLIHIEVSSLDMSAGKNAPPPSVGEIIINMIVSGIHHFANVSQEKKTCSRAKKRIAETTTRERETLNNGSNTEKTKLSKT